jgi:hypothetical protein
LISSRDSFLEKFKMARSRGVSAGKVLLLVTSALVFGDLIALTFVRAHPATAPVKSSPAVISSSNPNTGANAAKVGATPAVAASTSSKGTSTSQNNKPAQCSAFSWFGASFGWGDAAEF